MNLEINLFLLIASFLILFLIGYSFGFFYKYNKYELEIHKLNMRIEVLLLDAEHNKEENEKWRGLTEKLMKMKGNKNHAE